MREDLVIKRQREELSKKRKEVLSLKRSLNSLDSQYKRVIDELRRQLRWWQTNAWKATFTSLINRLKKGVKK